MPGISHVFRISSQLCPLRVIDNKKIGVILCVDTAGQEEAESNPE
jgi:hypothetical protein